MGSDRAGGATRDIPGIILAVIFIGLACLALWDTTNMADSDSYVFPRAVATAMIVFSILLIVYNLLRPMPGAPGPGGRGSTPRRVALVAAMLISTGLMPFVGFVVSGLAAFVAITLAAMYDPWTRFRLVVYPLVGVGVVVGFYTLFARVLQVPLPAGSWFE